MEVLVAQRTGGMREERPNLKGDYREALRCFDDMHLICALLQNFERQKSLPLYYL